MDSVGIAQAKLLFMLLSSENVTLIVQRICHPLSICILKGLRQG